MKIGINATFLNEKPTGVGIFTQEISTMLCTFHEETIVFASVKLRGVHKKQIQQTPLCIQGSTKFSQNLSRLVYSNTVLPLLMKKNRIDILFCPITEFPIITFSPLIITVHDFHPIYFSEQFGYASTYYKASLRLLAKWGRRVVVPSRFVRQELLKYVDIEGSRIDVIHPGYDKDRFRPLDEGLKKDFLKRYGIDGPFILFVGSLFPYKNIKTLLKTFLDIHDRIPHSMIVIGKKELSRERLPQHSKIHYLDYVKTEDIPGFYSYADIYVHPSLIEGFGITILEAMACGTPVLSSQGGALPEVVGEAGMLFSPEDSQQLGKLILRVIYNKHLRNTMRTKGFQQVKQFSWEKASREIFHTCEKVFQEMR